MDLKPIFPTKTNINQTNYYWFEKGFTDLEVSKIIESAKNYNFEKATIVDEVNTDKYRKSNITTFQHIVESGFIIFSIINKSHI